MMIVARDGGAQETRCQLIINVQDVNEAAPIFQTPSEDDLELLISISELAGTVERKIEQLRTKLNEAEKEKEDLNNELADAKKRAQEAIETLQKKLYKTE